MSVGRIEELTSWLEREEEMFGLTGAIERTIDERAIVDWLSEELGARYSPELVPYMYEAARYKYETLPTIGITTRLVEYPRWGTKQLWYRDIPTGRRVGLEAVQERLRIIGLF